MLHLLQRGIFVAGAIFVGVTMVDYFILGNTGEALPRNERLGNWREAKVRPACYNAVDGAIHDPQSAPRPDRSLSIDVRDYNSAIETTAALHCYVVTNDEAICQPDNRAYIVDYLSKYHSRKNAMLRDARRSGENEEHAMAAIWQSAKNTSITAALERHIREGRLIEDDFGWAIPDEIEALLEGHAGAAGGCPEG